MHYLRYLAATVALSLTMTGAAAKADSVTSPVRIGTSTAADGPTLGIPRWKGYMLETDPNQFWACYANGSRTSSNISYTTDGGRTWSNNAIQMDPFGYLDMHCSVFGMNGSLYATWPGLYDITYRKFNAPARSNADGGPLVTFAGTTAQHRSNIMVQNTGRIWLFTRLSYASPSENVLFNYSDDQGNSWTRGVAYATNSTSTRIGSMPYVGGNPALVVLHLDDARGFEYYHWNGRSFVARPDHSIYGVNMGQSRAFTHNVVRDTIFHLVFGYGTSLHHVWKNNNKGSGAWQHEVIDNSTATVGNEWFPMSTVKGDDLYLFYCKKSTTDNSTSKIYYKKWSQLSRTWTAPVLVSTAAANISNRDPNTCFRVPANSSYIPVIWRSGSGPFDVYFAKVVVGQDSVTTQLQYDLTMASAPTAGGTTSPPSGRRTYPSGTRVSISAFPSTNYTFASWSGGVENPSSVNTTVLMNGNKTVTANFAVASTSTGSISGQVTGGGVGMSGIAVELLNATGDVVMSRFTDTRGTYTMSNVPAGSYIVQLKVPLGFGPETASAIPVTLNGVAMVVNFVVRDASTGEVADYWWWKDQFQAIRSGTPRELGVTRADVNGYCASIFDHYYDRADGHAIRIDGVTYTGTSVRALTFDDCAQLYIDNVNSDNSTKTRKHLLACLLDVASGRLDQRTVVSADGATASQAINYFSNRYPVADATDWSLWYNLMKIESQVMIASGVIPLSTANIMYKPAEEDHSGLTPTSFSLAQNYPNPFNPSTTISYQVPVGSRVLVQVFNVLGREVQTLVDEEQPAGTYHVVWDGKDSHRQAVASGVYFYRLTAGELTQTRKMTLIK